MRLRDSTQLLHFYVWFRVEMQTVFIYLFDPDYIFAICFAAGAMDPERLEVIR